VLRGPANGPAFFVPVVLALALLIVLVLNGRWVLLGAVVAVAVLSEIWGRFGPQRRAGQVRRSWPWHDD
jgi:hypothetical protein